MRTKSRLASVALAASIAALGLIALSARSGQPATLEDARTFLARANAEMLRLSNRANRAGWVQSTHITVDTEVLSAEATEALVSAVTSLAQEAARFEHVDLPADLRRQIRLLENALPMAAPPDPKEAEELTRLVTSMEGTYGRGSYCPGDATGEECLDINAITRILAEDRDPARLLDVWQGWHRIAIPMKDDYGRFVELSNRGAQALGFADTGAMWRSKYDMPPEAFARELDRLWDQLRPLYVSLHAYVRHRLRAHYGEVIPAEGPLPAHLLGNLWQQDWSNIYPLVAPAQAGAGYSLTEILRARKTTPVEMVRIGEGFFTSLGFAALPPTFWERSMFTKPRDREVVCHASAWVIDNVDDLRIKMCIEPTAEDFTTIHHELGHNFYQRAYSRQPMIFRDSANDGFHEAVGDTLALSVTPEYLVKIGLLQKAPPASSDIGLLLRSALERLAFLPFGLLVDQWRWQVFSGEIPKADYNRAWWDLKRRYQGVVPAAPRGEEFFDPGAKYHVPANTPYSRYFLAAILQFQFHRALAQASGCTGPLHRCSIYGSEEAGRRLRAMLELGASRPWPDALEALTGQRQMDAGAMADYYAPLKTWLDEQNRGKPSGW